jgi:hypothetical protein
MQSTPHVEGHPCSSVGGEPDYYDFGTGRFAFAKPRTDYRFYGLGRYAEVGGPSQLVPLWGTCAAQGLIFRTETIL